ncbi:Primosomal replication protein N prime prime [Candidatus Enterovibrio escicola]|uniref:Primosomal replication protein N prime prime n=2 Tax=Candidatus Enterovibrio escicola TaxID=1927127 RepID=A0A2A5T295_9GAMM|nr:Primosomal replication protein N prime prime [Candidatus Enterovibrio escacola]
MDPPLGFVLQLDLVKSLYALYLLLWPSYSQLNFAFTTKSKNLMRDGMDLTNLNEQLQALAVHAADIDYQRGETIKPLFDAHLFNCPSRFLMPCVSEARNIVTILVREQQSGRLSTIRAMYLCEKLLNQVSALQREIATLSIRKKEKRFSIKHRISTGQLNQDLVQHQDWELQLDDMVRDAETKLGQCYTLVEQQQAQKQLLTLEKRLYRCQEARQKIETKITLRENKG